MARRSPLNQRYQKNQAPAGKTRKSASSAKPKRSASGSAPKPAEKGARRSAIVINPPTPEFRYWRRVWWIMLLTSVVLTLSSIAVRQWTTLPDTIPSLLLGIGYAGLFGAIYLDWTKLRKMRRDYMKSQTGEGADKK
jgi:hypothetical protein